MSELSPPAFDCRLLPESPSETVGVFDSGFGGLSVVCELLHRKAPFRIFYIADQANAPYGNRSLEHIRGWSEGISRFLIDCGVRLIVLACNSASAASLYSLREQFPGVAFVGMEPAVKPAAAHSARRRIGVIATAATLKGAPFRQVVKRFAGGHVVVARACPELVRLVESGASRPSPDDERVVGRAIQPLLAAGIDQLVLGCSHFSFIRESIARIAGPEVDIVDPSEAVARQTIRVAACCGINPCRGPVTGHLVTTGSPVRFAEVARSLVGASWAVGGAHWSVQTAKSLIDKSPLVSVDSGEAP